MDQGINCSLGRDMFRKFVGQYREAFESQLGSDGGPSTVLRIVDCDHPGGLYQRLIAALRIVNQTWAQCVHRDDELALAEQFAELQVPVQVQHGIPSGTPVQYWRAALREMVARSWAMGKGIHVDSEQSSNVVGNAARAAAAASVPMHILAPVAGLSTVTSEPVEVADGFAVAWIDDGHKARFGSEHAFSGEGNRLVRTATSIVTGSVELHKGGSFRAAASPPGVEEAIQLVTAIRWATRTQVSCKEVCLVPTDEFVGCPGVTARWIWATPSLDTNPWRFNGHALLDAPATDRVKQLCPLIRRARGGTAFAIERVNYASSRPTLEDDLIDQAIALEATLLADCEEELKFRLAQRGAILLRGMRNPENTHAMLSAAYKLRSKIVHQGERVGLDKLFVGHNPIQFVAELRDVVMEIVEVFVRHGHTNDAAKGICRELDLSARSGAAPNLPRV